jgi:hypothetical protein
MKRVPPTPRHPLLSQIQRIKVLQVLLLQQGSDCAVTIYYQIPLNQIMIMMGGTLYSFLLLYMDKKIILPLNYYLQLLKISLTLGTDLYGILCKKVLDVAFYMIILVVWSSLDHSNNAI